MKDILTVKETAQFLRKHPDTIRRWIEEKKLPARKLPAGKNGIYVILRSDMLERMVSQTVEQKALTKKRKGRRRLAPTPQIQLPI